MKTRTIINKAAKICKENGLDVSQIEFSQYLQVKEKAERLYLTVFYKKGEEDTNFSATTYSFDEGFSVRLLLNRLQEKITNLVAESDIDEITA